VSEETSTTKEIYDAGKRLAEVASASYRGGWNAALEKASRSIRGKRNAKIMFSPSAVREIIRSLRVYK